LEHLIGAAERPGIMIQVLSFTAGEHPAMPAPFLILQFDADPPVVYIENVQSALYVEEPSEVSRYTLVFDHLGATALSPKESVALMRAAARDLE